MREEARYKAWLEAHAPFSPLVDYSGEGKISGLEPRTREQLPLLLSKPIPGFEFHEAPDIEEEPAVPVSLRNVRQQEAREARRARQQVTNEARRAKRRRRLEES
jgi:hypothetical protein